MNAVRVTIKQRPTAAELGNRLSKIGRKLSDFREVHKHSSVLLDRWVQMNFRNEGSGLGGDTWPPFKAGGRWIPKSGTRPGYLDTGAKLLQDTGRLRASVLPFHSSATAGIGSDLPYSTVHDEGTSKIPKRRILPLPNEVGDELIELFERHVRKGLNA